MRQTCAAMVVCAITALAASHPEPPSAVRLAYMGTAGWQITDGRTTVLVDPYLSRLKRMTPNDDVAPDDPRQLFNNDDRPESDARVIDAHISAADVILITHTHYDHAFDMPYLARKTGAVVVGTESTYYVARAYGISPDKLIRAKGGEDLNLGSISVRVIPSVHGVLRRAPNVRPGPPAPFSVPFDVHAPMAVREFVEGGTLAYLIRIGGRQVLAFGSMNYVEREVEGLRPDVALIGAMAERNEIYDYTPRLLRALSYPRYVLPTHWDRFNVPYETNQAPAIARLQSFVDEVKRASPKTTVIVPKYFEWIAVP